MLFMMMKNINLLVSELSDVYKTQIYRRNKDSVFMVKEAFNASKKLTGMDSVETFNVNGQKTGGRYLIRSNVF